MKNIYLMLLLLGISVFLENPVFAQIAGQESLDPSKIPQFVDPLPHFAGQRVDASGGNLIIQYVPATQVAVSTGTELDNGIVGTDDGAGVGNYWVYRISKDGGETFTPPLWPSFTIEAQRGIPVNVLYENNLEGQTYADINLVVDQTLHWADPNGDDGSFDAYTGPVPVVPHLHGGEVPSESDGGPSAWFTPGMKETGPVWGNDGTDNQYHYPNTQEEATLWYHDHSLGVTRLNVYAGLAGFYFLRGPEEEDALLPGWSEDDLVQEVAPDGASGVFNSEPYLPEIEIVIQDRMFDTNGELYFPNEPSNPDIHPIWTPEFIGDIITVNGKTWPYLSVAPRKYRFRLLNGSNARFYNMWLTDLESNGNGPAIVQIGTDGGLMDEPAIIDPYFDDKLLLAPGERADIIIDFSKSNPGQVWTLKNDANTPYPDGDVEVAEGYTDRIMQFVVNGKMIDKNFVERGKIKKGKDKSVPTFKVWRRNNLPRALRKTPMVKLTDFAGNTLVEPDVIRQLTLNEVDGDDGPLEALVNNTKWDGNGEEDGLGVTELPKEGTTELWQFINLTADAHPIHVHLVQMQLVSRQEYNVEGYEEVYEDAFGGEYIPGVGPPLDYNEQNGDDAIGGNPAFNEYLNGDLKPANANERGWKDTYVMYPGEVTTFIVRYAPTDIPVGAPTAELLYPFDPSEGPGYVWHCHILDHEDNEMMRPYKVAPSPERIPAVANLKSGMMDNGLLADNQSAKIGSEFLLYQNYPNPFTSKTEIKFKLPEPMYTKLTLYNQNGQVVKVLLDQVIPAGNNTVRLNGSGLVKGVYFYQLSAGGNVALKKLIIN